MAKDIKTFRLSDRCVQQLATLGAKYDMSQADIIEQLVSLAYDCCLFGKEQYRVDLCDSRLGDKMYDVFLDDRLIGE